MRMRELLLFMFQLFCTVTAGAMIMVNIVLLFVGNEVFTGLEKIMVLPFIVLLCVLPTFIFAGGAIESAKSAVRRHIIHFLLTAAVLFAALESFYAFSGVGWFGWYPIILVFFLISYAVASVIFWARARRIADEINRKLKARHAAEQTRHTE
ncbi:MAG: DUF3021 family protein [Oscillospiraceae bacterium]|nr:DUF3021 family protein [Oscillospiraceae bacterium]